MPRARLWCFVVGEDSRIYIRLGDSVLKKYGAVLKIKCAKEDQDKGPDHIRVRIATFFHIVFFFFYHAPIKPNVYSCGENFYLILE